MGAHDYAKASKYGIVQKATRQELWEDIYAVIPWTKKVKETNPAEFPLSEALEKAAVELFLIDSPLSPFGTESAWRIRWALLELKAGRWLTE
ncbi:MAG: hypothetical protein GF334_12820 [Candidatus Altiarchaeales archaeon]|nr:hypothetical protein [Candidatus Altiarchaeales archaeon]